MVRQKRNSDQNSAVIRVGVDLMGSDASPVLFFEAAANVAESSVLPVRFSLFGTEDVVVEIKKSCQEQLGRLSAEKIQFIIVASAIEMEDDPVSSSLTKTDSSMIVGLKSLKEGVLDAFVSAGNTGALLVSSKQHLSMRPKIKRPALLTTLPTAQGHVVLVDVGADLSCKADRLLQYAFMGVDYQRVLHNIQVPRVGLLNVGSEPRKGTAEHRKAYTLLKENSSSYNFIGNIEARDLFLGEVDVLVTDGFSGNVLLKGVEGGGEFFLNSLERFSFPVEWIDRLRKHFHYAEYPGALLCGVKGIVVKCHGCASVASMRRSILFAMGLVTSPSRLA